MSGIYSDEFETNINKLYSPANIMAVARKFVEMERTDGAYSFGKLAKMIMPRPADWADEYGSTKGYNSWEKHSGNIPKNLRQRLTDAIAANLRSDNPRPMRVKVGENIDETYDVQIKTFVHDGHEYLGILMLCPNSSLRSAAKPERADEPASVA